MHKSRQSHHPPSLFTLAALPAATLPIYIGLGQAGTKYVGLHMQWLDYKPKYNQTVLL